MGKKEEGLAKPGKNASRTAKGGFSGNGRAAPRVGTPAITIPPSPAGSFADDAADGRTFFTEGKGGALKLTRYGLSYYPDDTLAAQPEDFNFSDPLGLLGNGAPNEGSFSNYAEKPSNSAPHLIEFEGASTIQEIARAIAYSGNPLPLSEEELAKLPKGAARRLDDFLKEQYESENRARPGTGNRRQIDGHPLNSQKTAEERETFLLSVIAQRSAYAALRAAYDSVSKSPVAEGEPPTAAQLRELAATRADKVAKRLRELGAETASSLTAIKSVEGDEKQRRDFEGIYALTDLSALKQVAASVVAELKAEEEFAQALPGRRNGAGAIANPSLPSVQNLPRRIRDRIDSVYSIPADSQEAPSLASEQSNLNFLLANEALTAELKKRAEYWNSKDRRQAREIFSRILETPLEALPKGQVIQYVRAAEEEISERLPNGKGDATKAAKDFSETLHRLNAEYVAEALKLYQNGDGSYGIKLVLDAETGMILPVAAYEQVPEGAAVVRKPSQRLRQALESVGNQNTKRARVGNLLEIFLEEASAERQGDYQKQSASYESLSKAVRLPILFGDQSKYAERVRSRVASFAASLGYRGSEIEEIILSKQAPDSTRHLDSPLAQEVKGLTDDLQKEFLIRELLKRGVAGKQALEIATYLLSDARPISQADARGASFPFDALYQTYIGELKRIAAKEDQTRVQDVEGRRNASEYYAISQADAIISHLLSEGTKKELALEAPAETRKALAAALVEASLTPENIERLGQIENVLGTETYEDFVHYKELAKSTEASLKRALEGAKHAAGKEMSAKADEKLARALEEAQTQFYNEVDYLVSRVFLTKDYLEPGTVQQFPKMVPYRGDAPPETNDTSIVYFKDLVAAAEDAGLSLTSSEREALVAIQKDPELLALWLDPGFDPSSEEAPSSIAMRAQYVRLCAKGESPTQGPNQDSRGNPLTSSSERRRHAAIENLRRAYRKEGHLRNDWAKYRENLIHALGGFAWVSPTERYLASEILDREARKLDGEPAKAFRRRADLIRTTTVLPAAVANDLLEVNLEEAGEQGKSLLRLSRAERIPLSIKKRVAEQKKVAQEYNSEISARYSAEWTAHQLFEAISTLGSLDQASPDLPHSREFINSRVEKIHAHVASGQYEEASKELGNLTTYSKSVLREGAAELKERLTSLSPIVEQEVSKRTSRAEELEKRTRDLKAGMPLLSRADEEAIEDYLKMAERPEKYAQADPSYAKGFLRLDAAEEVLERAIGRRLETYTQERLAKIRKELGDAGAPDYVLTAALNNALEAADYVKKAIYDKDSYGNPLPGTPLAGLVEKTKHARSQKLEGIVDPLLRDETQSHLWQYSPGTSRNAKTISQAISECPLIPLYFSYSAIPGVGESLTRRPYDGIVPKL